MSDQERNMVMAPLSITSDPAPDLWNKLRLSCPISLCHTIRSSAGTLVVAPASEAAKSSLVLKRFECAERQKVVACREVWY